MTKKSEQSVQPEQMSYGELRARLDEVMAKLQSPDCDVDEAAALYEQALGCVTQLEQYLQTAENRIKKVQADFATAGDA